MVSQREFLGRSALIVIFVSSCLAIVLSHVLCSSMTLATKRIYFKDPWRGGQKEPGTHMECRKRKIKSNSCTISVHSYSVMDAFLIALLKS